MENKKTIITALRTLFEPGDVFEIRILDAVLPNSNWPHIESGYFDYDHIETVPNLLANFKTYGGVYVTLNPVNPDLLARANNRFRKARSRETTSDQDILRRRWLLIDVDPARPAGISATDAERNLSFDKAMEIISGLVSMGFTRPMCVNSGNGTQLLYRIDLPTNDEGLVQRCLQALQPCSTDNVHVDLSVHNPARICRLPGTWNRKGDPTDTRPHRIAEILDKPDKMAVVSEELLQRLAQTAGCRLEAGGKPTKATDSISCSLQSPASSLVSPIDDFNQRGDLKPILEKHGWTLKSESDQQYWFRPGKTSGQHSATYDGSVFYVWSDNASPFAARKGYSRFGVYALLEYNGDDSAAINALKVQGYGSNDSDIDLSNLLAKVPDPSIAVIEPECDGSRAPSEISTATVDPGLIPDDLLHVPGFIDQVMTYTLETAPYPNRALAFCGAICLQSYLAARRVKDRMNNRSNIYIVALANSGVGKDRPRDVNSEICFQASILRGIADSFASGEGIEDAMFANQSMLFQTDEFDTIIGSIKKSTDGRSEMMMQILLKMYSASKSRYPVRKKAGQSEPLVIHQPSLTLYGTAVPQYFYKALSGRMLNNGLFARTLVLDAGPRSRGRIPQNMPIPQPIIDTAQWWANFNPGGVNSGNLSGFNPEPVVIPEASEAYHKSEAIWSLTDDAYEKSQNQGDETKMAIWARAFEKVRKLAMLYACSENHRHPQITEMGIDWAWRIVEHQTRRMLYMADLYVTSPTVSFIRSVLKSSNICMIRRNLPVREVNCFSI